MSFELLLVTVGLASIAWLWVFTRQLLESQARNRSIDARRTIPVNLLNNDGAVIVAEGRGHLVYLNQNAYDWFELNGIEPNLSVLAARVQPTDVFHDLFAEEGRALLRLGMRRLEASSHTIPTSDGQRRVVFLREVTSGDEEEQFDTSRALTIVQDISKAIASGSDLPNTMNALLSSISSVIEFDNGEVILWDQTVNRPKPVGRVGNGHGGKLISSNGHGGNGSNGTGDDHVATDETYTDWIARYQQPLLLNDVSARADVGPQASTFPYQSYVGVPLTVSGRFIGTIELASNVAHAFNHEDLRLLESVAGQAAVAIENSRLANDQANRILQLNGLQNIAQTMGDQAEPRELYAKLHERIANLMHVEVCGLLLYDSTTEALVSQMPFYGAQDSVISLFRIPVEDGSTARNVWQNETWWYSNDVLSDEMVSALNLRGLSEAIGLHSAGMVPLSIGHTRIGMLQVANKRDGGNFTDDDMRLLSIFAAQAAIVVENANLYERERRYIAELANLQQMTQVARSADQSLLVEQVTSRIAQLLDVEMCGILLYEETAQQKPILVAQNPFYGLDTESISFYQVQVEKDSIFEQIKEGRDYWFSNELGLETWSGARSFAQIASMLGMRTVMIAPLIAGETHLGLIQVSNKVDGENFTLEDGRVLSISAGQAAVLLDNAALYQNVTRLRRETEGLQAIANSIADQITTEDIFNHTLNDVRDIMQVEQIALGLLDTREGKLVYRAEAMHGATLDEPFKIDIYGKGFNLSPVMSRRLFLTADVLNDEQVLPIYRELAQAVGVNGAVLIVPLIINQRAIGELAISGKDGSFDKNDEILLLGLGAQIAAALERARLYAVTDADLRARVDEQEAIDRISRELNETLLLDRVLEVIRTEAQTTTNADGVSVVMLLPAQQWQDENSPEVEQRLGGRTMFVDARTDAELVAEGLTAAEQQMLRQGEALLIEDYLGLDIDAVPPTVRSAIIQPIYFGNDIVGFIHFFSNTPDAFSEATGSFVRRLGQQASLAVTNARRYRDQLEANERLKRRVEQVQRVFELNQSLRRGESMPELMTQLAENVSELTGFDKISIRIRNEVTDQFEIMAHRGLPAELFESPERNARSLADVEGMFNDPRWQVGKAYFFPADRREEWYSTEQNLIEDYDLKYSRGSGPRRWNPDDLLLVPINDADDRLIGTISLDDPLDGQRPTRNLIEQLELFAAQAAFVHENFKLIHVVQQEAEEARRERDRLAQLNLVSSEIQRAEDMTARLQATADGIHQAGWGKVQITLRDPYLEPTALISAGYSQEEAARLDKTLIPGGVWQDRFNDLKFHDLKLGQAYYLRYNTPWVRENLLKNRTDIPGVADDEWHPEDVLYLPLMGHDQKRIIGLIRMDEPADGKRPTQQSLQPIELFALQAAAAIENQRLYSETVRQADIEQQLNQLMEAMAATLDQTEIIHALAKGLQPFVIFTRMHLALVDNDDPNSFEMVRIELMPDQSVHIFPDNPIAMPGTAMGEVFQSGKARDFDLNSEDDYQGYTDLETWYTEGERAILMVPMVAGGDFIGVLRLGSELGQSFRFNELDSASLIQRMANLSAVSIQNSRLFSSLGESQSFNQAVVQSIQQGIIVLDDDMRIQLANQYVIEHYQWSPEAVQQPLFEYRPNLIEPLQDAVRGVLTSGQETQKLNVSVRGAADDTELIVNFYLYPLRERDRINGVVLLIEDITQRSMLEQDVRRRAEQLAALTGVSSSMTETLQPDQVVETVLDALDQVIPYDGVVLWLEHETRVSSLQIVAARGFADPETASVDDLIGLWIDIDDAPLFQAMAESRNVINVGNTGDDPQRFPMGESRVYKCILAAPLISKGGIIGVLQIEKREPQFYDENYEQLAQTFANQAAVALNNARLFSETQDRAEQLNRQAGRLALLNRVSNALSQSLDIENIFEITLRETARALDVNEAAAIEIKADDGICRVVIEHPRGIEEPSLAFRVEDSVVMQRIRDKMLPVLIKDISAEDEETRADLRRMFRRDDIMSTLFVPMVMSGKVIGTMRLDAGPEDPPLTNEQSELAQTIAAQASIAVQNASLYEQSLQRTYQLETLFEAGQATSGAIDVDDVMRRVATQMLIALRADSTEIMHWDQLENCLIVDEAKSSWLDEASTADIKGLVYDMVAFPLRRTVLEDHQVLTLRIDDEDLDAAEREHMKVHGVTNRILVPLIVNEVAIGITQIDIRDHTRFIDANQVRLVRTLANQAAVAIENARLSSETRIQIEELYLINELSKAVSSTVDIDELFEQVKTQLPLLTDAQYLYVALYDAEKGELTFPVAIDDQMNTVEMPPMKPGANDEFGYIIRRQTPLLLAGTGLNDVRKQFGISEPIFPDARSFLGVPMIAGDDFVGVLALRDDMESRKFDFSGQRILSTVSSQIAVTIQNAKLFTRITNFADELNDRVEERTVELAQEQRRLSTLYDLASEISAATLDLDRVLNRTLEAVSAAIGATSAIVLAIDDISDMLYVIAQRGLDVDDESERLELRQNEGLAGWVIQNRRSVLINDVQNDPRWITISDRDRGPRSAMASLLESAEDVHGVLMFYNTAPDAFNNDHLRLVNAASLQLANAMNNAELYSLIRDQAERLAAILRTEQIESTKTSAILNSVADGVMYANEKGIVRVFNNTAETILGLSSDKVLNQHIHELTGIYGGRESGWMSAIENWMADPTQQSPSDFVEVTLKLDDGRVINVRLSPVQMGDQFLGTVSVFRDVTREVEVDRLKSEFVATVSHELRTPMTSIKGYADLLLLGAAGEMSEAQQRFLQTIKQNADRLSILVNDLLEVSRIDQGQMQLRFSPIDVAEVVQNVCAHLAGRIKEGHKNIEIKADVADDLPPILGDFDRVIQILQNIADNAFNYSPDNGSIFIGAQYSPTNESVTLSIRDEGIGIPEAIHGRIFERFFRGDEHSELVMDTPGTGLGLAIVKELVTMHNGEIWFESELNEGTTFFIELPTDDASKNEPESDDA
jgi:PAS domain S-box-containing protein